MSNILYFWIFIMLHSVIFHFRKTWILCILLKLDASKAQDAKSTDHAKRCWQQHLMSKSDWFVEISQFVKLRLISRFSCWISFGCKNTVISHFLWMFLFIINHHLNISLWKVHVLGSAWLLARTVTLPIRVRRPACDPSLPFCVPFSAYSASLPTLHTLGAKGGAVKLVDKKQWHKSELKCWATDLPPPSPSPTILVILTPPNYNISHTQ